MSSWGAKSHRDFVYQLPVSRQAQASIPGIHRPKTCIPDSSSKLAHSSNPHIFQRPLHSIFQDGSDEVDYIPCLAVDHTASAVVVPGCNRLPVVVALPQDSNPVVDCQKSLLATLEACMEAGHMYCAVVGGSLHLDGSVVGRLGGSRVAGRLCCTCLTC